MWKQGIVIGQSNIVVEKIVKWVRKQVVKNMEANGGVLIVEGARDATKNASLDIVQDVCMGKDIVVLVAKEKKKEE